MLQGQREEEKRERERDRERREKRKKETAVIKRCPRLKGVFVNVSRGSD